MKMRNFVGIILSVFLVVNAPARAASLPDNNDRSGVIKGVIKDKNSGEPLEFVNVAVYDMNGSSLVSGGITNQKGEFEIKGVTNGEFIIEANFLGYEKNRVDGILISNESKQVNIGSVSLSPATLEIKGIDVVADKSPVEFKLDKKVVNVSQVISAAGGTAVDVLENTPSVQIGRASCRERV